MATRIDQKNYVKTALRLPPELHERVHEMARKTGRSYNAQLVHLIEEALITEQEREARAEQEVAAMRKEMDALLAADTTPPVIREFENLAFGISRLGNQLRRLRKTIERDIPTSMGSQQEVPLPGAPAHDVPLATSGGRSAKRPSSKA